MEFKTKRLMIRPWNEQDAEALFEYASDPDIGSAAGFRAHESVEDSRNVIKNGLNGPEAYAICLKTDSRAVGAIELLLNDRNRKSNREDECELGFWIGKPFWGQAMVPEAAEALLRHAFEDLHMNKVWCGYYAGNTKSKRAQEKLGFQYDYTRKNVEVPLLQEFRTEEINCLTREQWEKKGSYSPVSAAREQ